MAACVQNGSGELSDRNGGSYDLRPLVSHDVSVQGNRTVEEVYKLFAEHDYEFMAVLDGGRLLGMCAKREIGMLLGARFGFSLFARKPIREHLSREFTKIAGHSPLPAVFQEISARSAETFYDDVVLVDGDGNFLGLIPTRTLVQLQNRILAGHIRQLKLKNEQIEADLAMARELQQALMPARYPVFPPDADPARSVIQFHHRYLPSGTMGGDFFHVMRLSDSRAGVFICDVMGHGVRSALITTMLRALVEELSPATHDPGGLLGTLNVELSKILKQTGEVLFTTAFYMVLEAGGEEVGYGCAGHPAPFHLRRETGTITPLCTARGVGGPALGLFAESTYGTSRCRIAPGDGIVLFTDGIYEVDNPECEEYGERRLMDFVKRRIHIPAEEMLDGMLAEVQGFAGRKEFDDDVCLVAIDVA
ncbi:MAG TPA: SpoIIE family protein phosphatase [Chthoniobacteraceae bacterium]|nr:SpoIIE family protein phosphatase [Chthoniobacteraceae bacterium]